MKNQADCKVVVLGATGFLGAYSCLELKRCGYNVVAVGHRQGDGGFFKDYGIQYIGGFSVEEATSFSALPVDVAAVVNLAGSMPARAVFAPVDYIGSIITGAVNLCEWLRTKTQCRRVIFNTTPSDVWHEFKQGVCVGDDSARSYPATGGDHDIYAIAKIAATDILDHYRIAHGFRPIVFRHMNIYGFHPSAKYFVDGVERVSPWRIIMRRAVSGECVEIYGDGSRKLELLSVYDFASAVTCAVGSDHNVFGMFNLAGTRPYTLEEEILTIVEVFGSDNMVTKAPNKPSRMETMLDRSKANHILGWTPVFGWRQTCIKIKEEFQSNRFIKLWGKVDPRDISGNDRADNEGGIRR